MPKGVSTTLGVSPSEVLINSGGEQFLLVNSIDGATPSCDITFANLPDGTQFAGSTGFTGNPLFTLGTTNYIWFDTNTGLLTNSTSTFTGDTTQIPLWQIALDGSGNFTSIIDKRPWLSGPHVNVSSIQFSDLADISIDEAAGFNAANSITATNPVATINDLTATGALLQGKTFYPEPVATRALGNVYQNLNASDSTDGVFSVNLLTAGTARTIPTNATHVILRASIDANLYSGNGSVDLYTGEYDASLAIGSDPNGFVETGKLTAWVNGDASGGGENSLTDTGVIITPFASTNPHLSNYVDITGTVATSLRNIVMAIDGWLIDDTGSAPAPKDFSFIPVTHPNLDSAGSTVLVDNSSGAITNQALSLSLGSFVGTGYNSADVRGFYVKVKAISGEASVEVKTRLPDNTQNILCRLDAVTATDDRHSENMLQIPVISGQTNVDLLFNLSAGSGNASIEVEFLGAWQFG